MMHYFRVYKRLFFLNFAVLVSYRLNFINYLISGTIWGFFSIISILLLTSKTATVLGWQRHEILLLTGVHAVSLGIFHMLFSSNFERFPRYIELGQLDTFLLKPIDAQALVSVWLIRVVSLSRVLLGVGFIWYLVTVYHIKLTILQVIGFIPLMFCSLILMYGIWFMVITLTIWFTRLTNLPEVLYAMNGITRYPPEVVKELTIYVFLFLFPLTLIVVTPAKMLLGSLSFENSFILFFFAGVFFFCSRKLWQFALRSYTSASS